MEYRFGIGGQFYGAGILENVAGCGAGLRQNSELAFGRAEEIIVFQYPGFTPGAILFRPRTGLTQARRGPRFGGLFNWKSGLAGF